MACVIIVFQEGLITKALYNRQLRGGMFITPYRRRVRLFVNLFGKNNRGEDFVVLRC